MNDLGYADLSADDLVGMRIHGVTADFVRSLADEGYTEVEAEDLVVMRIHGVDTDFIREARQDGYTDLTVGSTLFGTLKGHSGSEPQGEIR